MALVRVAQYNSTPTVVGDYQAQNAHLQAFTNQLLTQQFILDSGTAQPVIKQGCYVSHGGSLYVADADTAITGSPADGSVYIRVSGTTTLTVEFINDISGYTWNHVYTALTSGSYTLLPYLLIKSGTGWGRYNFNRNAQSFGDTRLNSLAVLNNATVGGTLGVTGAISGASLNTGSGALTFNQDVKTTASPTFKKIQFVGSGWFNGIHAYAASDGFSLDLADFDLDTWIFVISDREPSAFSIPVLNGTLRGITFRGDTSYILNEMTTIQFTAGSCAFFGQKH